MKIAVAGKGGVGKSSVAAGLALISKNRGKKVIAIDADPDANLATILGFKDRERPTPISELKKIILERIGDVGAFFKMNPRVDDIPDRFSKEKDNIRLLEMGTVKKGGAGCVCPESAFLKALLSHVFINRDETVIVDMEAGVEHLGRGTAQSMDRFIIVVEPNQSSLDTAEKINRLASNLKIKDVIAIGNKVRTEEDRRFMEKEIKGMYIKGFITLDETVLNSRDKLPQDSKFIKDLERIYNVIEDDN